MKIFRRIQNDFDTIGVGLHHRPFNLRNLAVLFVICIGSIANCEYFFTANTFQEQTKSVFVAITLVSSIIFFSYVSSQIRQFLDILNEAEMIINDRK